MGTKNNLSHCETPQKQVYFHQLEFPKMKRRDFLKATTTVTALAGLTTLSTTNASAAQSSRDYYEVRTYHLKDASAEPLLLSFFEKAAIPALNRLGVKPVGVFTEIEPKDGAAVYVVLTYPTIETFIAATTKLNSDADYLKAGADYLQVTKANPAFVRIDSWLMLAFAGMPRLELPSYCKERKSRILELRTYESHSELKAQKKVDMFNAGEIDAMHEVGLGPIFYGQVLVGKDLPHLTYMLSGENAELHKEHWKGFGAHPTWKKLLGDPQYADTVTKVISRMLKPAECSQI